VLNDAMWSKYGLGAHYGIEDPLSKAPSVRNLWSGVGAGSAVESSVSGLQQRGVRFLGCMNAISRLSNALAAKTGGREGTIADELRSGILPNVTLVPAMIVAVSRAQESGLTYAYLA